MLQPTKIEVVKPGEEDLIKWVFQLKGSPLVQGRYLICPYCEKQQDILEYTPLHFVEKYADQLCPVMKCRCCRHAFSLRP